MTTLTAIAERLIEAGRTNPIQTRQILDAWIEKMTDPNAIATLELFREYATNPAFRTALADHTFALTC